MLVTSTNAVHIGFEDPADAMEYMRLMLKAKHVTVNYKENETDTVTDMAHVSVKMQEMPVEEARTNKIQAIINNELQKQETAA
jgi:hypothetical protein